jgi:hypothetical protein
MDLPASGKGVRAEKEVERALRKGVNWIVIYKVIPDVGAQYPKSNIGTDDITVKASICNICGQQFSTTQSLVLHQRTHSGEKPHKCPFPGCGYAAAQASQLSTFQDQSTPIPYFKLLYFYILY